MTDNYKYEKGHTFQELLSIKDGLISKSSDYDSKTPPYSLVAYFSSNCKEALKFDSYEYFHLWAGLLIKNGRPIKRKLIKYFKDTDRFGDAFHNKMKPLKNVSNDVVSFRDSIENYENEIYDFINCYQVTLISEKSNETLSVINALEDINRMYDRVFSLSHQKISNISRARLSVASISLSFVAVVVAVIALVITSAAGKTLS